VAESEQVLLTATDINMFDPEFVKKSEVWNVEDGSIRK
jgi:recombinational DNA repair ATPase RecF